MVGNLQSLMQHAEECSWTVKLNAAFVMLLSNNADYFRATKVAEELNDYNPGLESKTLLGFCNLFSAKDDREYL